MLKPTQCSFVVHVGITIQGLDLCSQGLCNSNFKNTHAVHVVLTDYPFVAESHNGLVLFWAGSELNCKAHLVYLGNTWPLVFKLYFQHCGIQPPSFSAFLLSPSLPTSYPSFFAPHYPSYSAFGKQLSYFIFFSRKEKKVAYLIECNVFLRSLAFEAVSLVYTDSFVLCCIIGIVAESMVEKKNNQRWDSECINKFITVGALIWLDFSKVGVVFPRSSEIVFSSYSTVPCLITAMILKFQWEHFLSKE